MPSPQTRSLAGLLRSSDPTDAGTVAGAQDNTPTVGPLVKQPHGGALRVGGKHFGPGKHRGQIKSELVDMLHEILTSSKCKKAITTILGDPKHKHFPSVLSLVWDRVYGKPTETIDLTAKFDAEVRHEPLTILLPLLDGAAPRLVDERIVGAITAGALSRT
jgi:hypothetical protein